MAVSRRRFLTRVGGLLAVCQAPAFATAAALTPRQPTGPFYPDQPSLDDDNDLIHVAGQSQPARGDVTELSGRLLASDGRPIPGARVEIWQCDVNGRYRHSRDPGTQPIDPGFQGFGHAQTDAQGRYRFLTIRPVPYPGRTPHIHVAVTGFDFEPFVTQLYVAGEPRNAGDFLYRRVPEERRGLITTPFASVVGSDVLQARWDLVLGLSQT